MRNYLKWLKKNNYSPNTIKTYSSILLRYEYFFNDIRLIKKEILKHEESPNTCILHYNIIYAYMTWKSDKRIHQLKNLKLPQIPIIYREVFTKDFLYERTTISIEDSDLQIKKKMTIRFLYETGMRASELKKITRVTDEYIVIRGKGNKNRSVFYNPKTFSLFHPYIHTEKTLRNWVKEILGQQYSPHSIRRSFATHLLSNGATPKMVQLQLGHSSIETTFSYLNLSLQDNSKIYSKFFNQSDL